ncbi:hypothetical protein Q0F99_15475 [Rathayibacter oskolensis]|uniref:hypothetical protein n=1 Tax=Rathayibacter oskolensis TaxID=1891671 RepID=UPI00265EEBA2|nr:hypothetical protein [Rathayibacter oskolensis]WKK71034.1 hypothetical protein Q0F99_15475 [Rathayibacter oskolensis]
MQLIAGGSGLVPLMAMAREHGRSGSAAPMRLLYSVRSPVFAYYQGDLRALAETPPEHGGVGHRHGLHARRPAGCPPGRPGA